MKKLLVYDVAAESGGAFSVLKWVYNDLKESKEFKTFFVLSVVDFPEAEGTHIINLKWVKKSWFHRFFCDVVYMPFLIKKLKIDHVLSLQNIGVARCKVPQTVYVHNAIPFTEHKFLFSSDCFLWVYQNIIGKMTIVSLKKVNEVIVQTEWMKNAVEKKCQIPSERIKVKRYVSEHKTVSKIEREKTEIANFFYPTSPIKFKNLEVLIQACEQLVEKGVDNYIVRITFLGDENKLAKKVKKMVIEKHLPIEFIGYINSDKMVEYYNKSILVFTSYLETVGLPLIEAQDYDAPIIAADCYYAHEAIGKYQKALFFNYKSADQLVEKMRYFIDDNK